MGQGATSFLLGVLAFQQMPVLPSTAWGGLIPIAAVLGWRVRRLRSPAWFACGFLWTLLQANFVLQTGLEPALEGEDVVLEGVVAGIPESRPGGLTRFELAVERLTHGVTTHPGPGRVRLNWYNHAPELTAGERWRLVARLKRPRGFANPGGFDFEAQLYRKRIRATGYVREDARNTRLASQAGYTLQRLRQGLGARIEGVLAGAELRGVVTALAIGDRQGIGRDQWETFRRTGTSHLVAISGLHIGLVAGMCFFAARWAWARSERLTLTRPAPDAGAVAALLGAAVYAALAGFSVPTQRALIMVAIVMAAVLLRRARSLSRTLLTALLAVLIYDPLAVMDGGFWLSFCAVAAILFATGQRPGHAGWWRRWGQLHVVVFIGLAPLMLVLFQQLPLGSPIANSIAVPWVSVVVVPLVLAGCLLLAVVPVLGESLLHLAGWSLSGLWPMLEWMAAADVLQWTQHAPAAWTLPLAGAGTVLLLAPHGFPGRWLGVLWLMPALLIVPRPPAEDAFRITLLDVGQGLAAVVRTLDHALVFDTGARFGPEFDAGDAVLVPYLRHFGIRSIDVLVLSHGDNDHVGGADTLANALPIDRVLSSVPEKVPGRPVERCASGSRWRWNGVGFEIPHPDAVAGFHGNDASCVLMIDNGNGRVLLTGDIQARAEAALVRRYGERLSAHTMVAPHHGSKTSSTPAFVAAVRPEYVLFPSGYRNRWGFPHREVVDRYHAMGARIYSSADHGAVTFEIPAAGEVLAPETYRQRRNRYWHDR